MAKQNTTRKSYPSDLTDAEWHKIEPLSPKPKSNRGRKRKHTIREILNAIFYIVRAGCAWRMLPHDLPPWKTVYHYFRLWRKDGTWAHINAALRTKLREAAGRDQQPSAAILDSQSVKMTSTKGVRGYDAGKKVKVWFGFTLAPLAAFAGSLAAVLMVYVIARVGPRTPITTLLLAGFALSSSMAAAMSFLMLLSGETMQRVVLWTMGGTSASGWRQLQVMIPLILLGSLAAYLLAGDLNAFLLGEDPAAHLGVNVERRKPKMWTFPTTTGLSCATWTSP